MGGGGHMWWMLISLQVSHQPSTFFCLGRGSYAGYSFLKLTIHRDFWASVFAKPNPPGPLTTRVKMLLILVKNSPSYSNFTFWKNLTLMMENLTLMFLHAIIEKWPDYNFLFLSRNKKGRLCYALVFCLQFSCWGFSWIFSFMLACLYIPSSCLCVL